MTFAGARAAIVSNRKPTAIIVRGIPFSVCPIRSIPHYGARITFSTIRQLSPGVLFSARFSFTRRRVKYGAVGTYTRVETSR